MRVIMYMAMTLNGMIAKRNDETPWLGPEWKAYNAMVRKTKNIIVGRRTYAIMKEDNEFKRCGNPFTIVVSRRGGANDKNTIFASSPVEALSLLKDRGFKSALVGGGGKLDGSFMRAGLVDEVYMDIEPFLFGNGIRLFSDVEFAKRLRLVGTKMLSKDEIQLHYRVI
ncbi:MAG: dihydrofolate reductase [Candidatus Micrarchaeota archaeon]|nr:dihydrofolate reductase [Candidatus Micrarchaeota archaeon]